MDAFIYTSLMVGMWWILPLFATTNSFLRGDFVNGHWAKTSRISFKVKGACSIFRMATEAKRVQATIVDHVLSFVPPTRKHFKTSVIGYIKRISSLFKNAKKVYMWSMPLIGENLLWRFSDCNVFNFVQVGCILVHHGLADTWVFKMTETQVDLLLRRRGCKDISFRKVIQEILAQPELSTRFLSSFDYIPSHAFVMILIPSYSTFMSVLIACSMSQMVPWLNRMPKCILGAWAYLCVMRGATHRYVSGSTIRRECNVFERYLRNKGDVCASGKLKVYIKSDEISENFEEIGYEYED